MPDHESSIPLFRSVPSSIERQTGIENLKSKLPAPAAALALPWAQSFPAVINLAAPTRNAGGSRNTKAAADYLASPCSRVLSSLGRLVRSVLASAATS